MASLEEMLRRVAEEALRHGPGWLEGQLAAFAPASDGVEAQPAGEPGHRSSGRRSRQPARFSPSVSPHARRRRVSPHSCAPASPARRSGAGAGGRSGRTPGGRSGVAAPRAGDGAALGRRGEREQAPARPRSEAPVVGRAGTASGRRVESRPAHVGDRGPATRSGASVRGAGGRDGAASPVGGGRQPAEGGVRGEGSTGRRAPQEGRRSSVPAPDSQASGRTGAAASPAGGCRRRDAARWRPEEAEQAREDGGGVASPRLVFTDEEGEVFSDGGSEPLEEVRAEEVGVMDGTGSRGRAGPPPSASRRPAGGAATDRRRGPAGGVLPAPVESGRALDVRWQEGPGVAAAGAQPVRSDKSSPLLGKSPEREEEKRQSKEEEERKRSSEREESNEELESNEVSKREETSEDEEIDNRITDEINDMELPKDNQEEEEEPVSKKEQEADQTDEGDKENRKQESNETDNEEDDTQREDNSMRIPEDFNKDSESDNSKEAAKEDAETIDCAEENADDASKDLEDSKRWNKMDELAKELRAKKCAGRSGEDNPDRSMKIPPKEPIDLSSQEAEERQQPQPSREDSGETEAPILKRAEEKKEEEGSANRKTEDQELESLAAIEAELENVAHKLHDLRRG